MLAAECPASVPRTKKKGLAVKLTPCFVLAGGRGFEPRLAESESQIYQYVTIKHDKL